jgi:hypothetical protein
LNTGTVVEIGLNSPRTSAGRLGLHVPIEVARPPFREDEDAKSAVAGCVGLGAK